MTVSFLSACAGLTPTREVTEGYRVYDVRGTQNHSEIVANLKSTMQKNADKVRFTNDIPPYPLPEKAGRFTLTNPFGKSGMGALLAAQGHSVKIPQCADSVFSATSNDSFRGAENTTFFVCLIPYTEGYHMDVYYTYTKVSGGFSPEALGRSLAQQMVGDSSQFIPRIIAALETSVQTSGAEIKLLDSYPQ
ncbi:MAG: hypothetical protein JKY42_00030 [Flavobacteriales bacterium]|nr:hypothetical protein [Flavobacteriales bacterium]